MKGRAFLAGAIAAVGILGINSLAIAQTATPDQNETPPTSIEIPTQVEGALEEGDHVLPSDESLYDDYVFEGKAGQTITITLDSEEFDPYLALIDPQGQVVGENDDADGSNQNSLLEVTLDSDGTYMVIANGFDKSSRGNYVLEVNVQE